MEDEIKELLGENYQEGMTGEQVQEAFKKMLLSTGAYVNKDMANAEKKKMEDSYKSQIATLNETLNSKMTDSEKAKAAQAQRDAEFEEMKKQLLQSQINGNRMSALSNVAEVKALVGLEDEDKDFEDFLTNISSQDSEKTNKVSKYIASLVKQAYAKGQSDAEKNNLGKMGKDGKSSDGDDDGLTEVDQKVKNMIEKKFSGQSKSYHFGK